MCHIVSGYICISVPEQRLQELDIKMMVPENQERHKTAYTVTVDAAEGASLPADTVVTSNTDMWQDADLYRHNNRNLSA